MKKTNFKKIVLIIALSIILIVLGGGCYWPFIQFKNINVAWSVGRSNGSMHDKTLEFITRIQQYPSCWFIHKGDKYTNIPLLENDTIPVRKVDIRFNWDNSITITEGINRFDLHVNKVEIWPELFPFSDNDYPLKMHENDDSLFAGILMSDNNNSDIVIYRQKSAMPYKGKRVGFRINITLRRCGS